MPEVIADTSPLQYLHQIGCLELLAELFQRVIVPDGVAQEIQQGVRQGVNLPDLGQLPWVTIVAPSAPAHTRLSARLGQGECEVLCWALQSQDALVLLDDAEARKQAKALGIRFTGTLGVLVKARQDGRVPVVLPLLDQLQKTGFFIDAAVRAAVLATVGETPWPTLSSRPLPEQPVVWPSRNGPLPLGRRAEHEFSSSSDGRTPRQAVSRGGRGVRELSRARDLGPHFVGQVSRARRELATIRRRNPAHGVARQLWHQAGGGDLLGP